MKQTKTSKIALLSILTALSVVLGYIVKIPTQTGILTLLQRLDELRQFVVNYDYDALFA